MKAIGWALVLVLLVANTAGTAWLVVREDRRESPPLINDATVAQLDKLFSLVGEFRAELSKIGSQANFPEEKKKEWKDQLRWREMAYEAARLTHVNVRSKRTIEALTMFLAAARMNVATPKGSFQTYNVDTRKFDSFANLSKLESMEEEFDVLMVALLRDMK